MSTRSPQLFEACPEQACAVYRRLFRPESDELAQVRRVVETQYKRLAPYLDRQHFCSEILHENKLYQRLWELKVGSALLLSGHTLERSRASKRAPGGPDFRLQGAAGLTYVEAIRPQDHRLADQWAKLYKPDGHTFTAADLDEQVLRLTGAVKNKREKWAAYVAEGLVEPGSAFVIAIGDDGARPLYGSRTGPMFDALFGLGPEIATFDALTLGPLETRVTYQPLRTNDNGAPVNSFLFGGPDPAAEVSAIIYSATALFSQPAESFDDLVLIHNPQARTPIPEGFLRFGEEWARRGKRMEVITARRPAAASGSP